LHQATGAKAPKSGTCDHDSHGNEGSIGTPR